MRSTVTVEDGRGSGPSGTGPSAAVVLASSDLTAEIDTSFRARLRARLVATVHELAEAELPPAS